MGDRKRESGPRKTMAEVYVRDLPGFSASDQLAVCEKYAKTTGLVAHGYKEDRRTETSGLIAACAGMILLQEDVFLIATKAVLGRKSWARRYVESALREAAAEFGARLVIVDQEEARGQEGDGAAEKQTPGEKA